MNRQRVLHRLAPAGLFVLILLFFARLTFTNLILARGDTFTYFYPYWHAAGEALRAGRLPLWNDLLFMGAPFLANSQVGLLYPPNWLLWVFVPHTASAIKLTILLHTLWAGLGMLALLNGPMRLRLLPALTGAALFALGGHLTAHIEQINQLQGLSWLPWLLLLLARSEKRPRQWGPLLAAALALQLLSGHTQTVFISIVTLALMALWWGWCSEQGTSGIRRLRLLFVFLLAGIGALLLTLPQLVPTLELSGLSNRAGGLVVNDVIAFSLHPALIGRSLLPGYDFAPDSEYIGTIGLSGLALALIGAWAVRRERRGQFWIMLAIGGLLLALGGWTPLYWMLGTLPGFNLFRVPARWLVLWALGSSILAAHGVQYLLRTTRGHRRGSSAIGGSGLLLVGWAFLSPYAADQWTPGVAQPSLLAVLGWLITLAAIVLVLWRLPGRKASIALALLAGIELLAASAHMPYNRLTAPAAFDTERPTITQLRVRRDGTTPPDRYLSISNILFGPNDQPVIRAIYEPQVPETAIYDLLIATKLKDIIAPNLGMIWELPGVDGFDGGILPLHSYTRFTELLLDSPPPDGRLRENLPGIPQPRWLDLMGTRYVITDRTGDDWYDGVYYDLSWVTPLAAGDTITVDSIPPFEATALGMVYEPASGTDEPLAVVEVSIGGAVISGEIHGSPPANSRPYALSRVSWETPGAPDRIRITGQNAGLTLYGAALIDERTGAFQILTVTADGQWQLIHASDVKVYESQRDSLRAALVYRAQVIPDTDATLASMRDPAFDPRQTVILNAGDSLASAEGIPTGEVAITTYAPEQVEISVSTSHDAYLLLTDAWYPGWTAALDGTTVPIYRADILFRAVFIPSGTHTLVMHYTPTGWGQILPVGVLAWLVLLAGTAAIWLRARAISSRAHRN